MKKIYLSIIIGVSLLVLSSCKPTTTETDVGKSINYEEQLASLDISQSHVEGQLDEFLYIDADITPQALYADKLGIYEFSYDYFDLDLNSAAELLNEYLGEGTLSYKDSLAYWIENELEETYVDYKYSYQQGPQGSLLYYQKEGDISGQYGNFSRHLFSSEYPITQHTCEDIREQAEKLVSIFDNYSADVIEYIVLKDSEDYSQLEDTFRKIDDETDDLSDEGADSFLQMIYDVGGEIAASKRTIYGIRVFENIRDTGLLLRPINRCSYKNLENKKIPETCITGADDELWININGLWAVFDEDKELQAFSCDKHMKVNEVPESCEDVIDARAAINICYESLKPIKRPVWICAVDLIYTGVVREEGEELEDYIAPVWQVSYYNSLEDSGGYMYIDAVTGEEM